MWLKSNRLWLSLTTFFVLCLMVINSYAEKKDVIMKIDGNPIYADEWNQVRRMFYQMPDDMFAYYFKGVNLIAYAAKKEGLECDVKSSGWMAKKALMACYIRDWTSRISTKDLEKEIESYAKVNWKEYLIGKDRFELSGRDKIVIRKKILESKIGDIEKEILNYLEKKYEVKVCSQKGC